MDCTFASAGVEVHPARAPARHRGQAVQADWRAALWEAQPRFGLGHEMRLIQGIRVALDVIHQLGNLLFREQVEHEVARQVSESESNARICQ